MSIDKRYQVFVSSTYADLQDERQEVMQALLELECIPAGMELFPAANEDQWTLIKGVIDDCDYYIVIIAGRYGSIGPGGLSYTEMEYRYAIEQNKPVIGFLHKAPSTLAVARCESTEEGRHKLDEFRALAQAKMCRFWDSPADLGSKVSRSLVNLIKSNPAIGWVRGDLVPDATATEEILGLRKRVEELDANLRAVRLEAPEGTASLAQGDDHFELRFTFTGSPTEYSNNGRKYTHSLVTDWNAIFGAVSPYMIDEVSDGNFRNAVTSFAAESSLSELRATKSLKDVRTFHNFAISGEDFQTIKVQLRALGLIAKSTKSRSVRDTLTYWTLTPYGDMIMTRLRAIGRTADGAGAGN